jgi:hypothetical protein
MYRTYAVLLCLLILNLTYAQNQSEQSSLNYQTELSQGRQALKDYKFTKAFGHFHSVWKQTSKRKKLHGIVLRDHLEACKGLAWCYMYRAEQDVDSVNFFLNPPGVGVSVMAKDSEFDYQRAVLMLILKEQASKAANNFRALLRDSRCQTPNQQCKLWFFLGLSEQRLQNWKEAGHAFIQSARLGHSVYIIGTGNVYFTAQLRWAEVQMKQKSWQQSASAIQQAATFLQNQARAFSLERVDLQACWGELAIQRQGYSKALEQFEMAINILDQWLIFQDFSAKEELYIREKFAHIYTNAAWCAVQLGQKYTAITWIERGRNRQLNQHRLGNRTMANLRFDSITLQGVLNNLDAPQSSAIIRYFQARDTMFALVIDQGKDTLIKIRDTSYLRNLARAFINSNGLRNDEFDGLSNWIYKCFFFKIDIVLEKYHRKHLLIIPDAMLNLVSFDALSTGKKHNRYILYKYAIWYAPGLTFLMTQDSNSTPLKRLDWLGVGPDFSVPHPPFGALEYSITELKNSKCVTSGSLLIRERATKKNILEKQNSLTMLHFSSHGKLSKYNTELNQIILSGQGRHALDSLTAGEIKRASCYKGKDIVLSTCYSGSSHIISRQEGLMNSVSQAFLYARSNTVLQANWPLPDMASSVIFSAYYEQLYQGKNQAEALQQAKISYIESTTQDLHDKYGVNILAKNYTSPYFWHMIVGYGIPHKVIFPPHCLYRVKLLATGMGMFLLFLTSIFVQRLLKRHYLM